MKALHKFELAAFAGVSIDTMKKYIKSILQQMEENPKFKDAFSDYNIRSKILTPKQVQILCDHYSIIVE